ncbi:hypothetical protein HDV02_003106 [Globomyces sp. JEL0801]|nr:hypothetical protein HDV02_003106 [Globomyces sp. JEL0801]
MQFQLGGLTEGNVQMSIAMISDISDSTNRSKTLALVGICFAVGFTLGPPLGAYMTNINLKEYFPTLPINSYSSPALFAFILIIIETIYLLVALPETLNFKKETNEKSNRLDSNTNPQSLTHLSIIHFLFLFVFSGMEFTLTFLTYDRFQFSNTEQGKLLAFFGILTAIVQGGYVRRVSGILSCGIGLLIIGLLAKTELIYLYLGSAFMAFTSGTVVTSLTSLVSLADHQKQGETLGYFRSAGQLGRCLGPMVACSGYWVLGSTQLYTVSGIWMVVLAGISWLIVPSKFVKGFKQD